jgi:hypothetical protein
MTITDILISLGVLAIVLFSDLGTHRFGPRRLRRPIIGGAIVVALYLHTIPTAGGDLALELACAGIGLGLGLLSISTIRLTVDPRSGDVLTRAGWGYALLWIASVGGRLLFGFCAQNVFPGAFHSFMVSANITGGDAIRAAFIVMILSEVFVRTATLAVRAVAIRRAAGLTTGSAELLIGRAA